MGCQLRQIEGTRESWHWWGDGRGGIAFPSLSLKHVGAGNREQGLSRWPSLSHCGRRWQEIGKEAGFGQSQLRPRLLYGITWDPPRPEQTVALAFVMPPTWVRSGLASALRLAPPTPEIFTSCILKFLKRLPTSYSLNPTVERRREVPIIKFPGQVFLPDLIYSSHQPC